MQSNNDRGGLLPPSLRSRTNRGTDLTPTVLYPGASRRGMRSGFLFKGTAPAVSLEMSAERVRQNLLAANRLTP